MTDTESTGSSTSSGGSGSSESGTESGSSSGSSTETGTETGTDTGSESGSESSESSTGDPVFECDDGTIVPGELCFSEQLIEGIVGGDRGLEVLDIDDDGDLDMATGSNLIRSNGDGTYAVTNPMPGGPFIAAGQLDADPLAEIVIPLPMTVEVHHADAAGEVSSIETYPFAGDFGYAAKIGDLVGSAEPDVAVAALSSGHLEIFENDGGMLIAHPPIVLGFGARHVEIADLNADGFNDVIVADDGAQVFWVMGNGKGFDAPISELTDSLFTTLSVADVDQDGVPDMIGASPTGSFAEILYGDGAGGIDEHQVVAVPVDPRAIGIGDFNSDGIPDLAAPSYEGGTDLAIVLGEGSRSFAEPMTLEFPTWGHDIAVADLNDDDVPDLAVYGEGIGLLLSTP